MLLKNKYLFFNMRTPLYSKRTFGEFKVSKWKISSFNVWTLRLGDNINRSTVALIPNLKVQQFFVGDLDSNIRSQK